MPTFHIEEEQTISVARRYTSKQTDIVVSLVMEKLGDEPSMYLIISYPVTSSLMPQDLALPDRTVLEDEGVCIEGEFHVAVLNFVSPALSTNEDPEVYSKTAEIVSAELFRLFLTDKSRNETPTTLQ